MSLIHCNRSLDFFFVVAARVLSGRRHECPVLYELVDELVRAVDRGRFKILIVDRGLIDGEQMGRLKQQYSIDTIVPVRTNMNLYADALGLTRLRDFQWEPYGSAPSAPRPHSAGSPVAPKPLRIQKREAKRQQTLAQRKSEEAATVALKPAVTGTPERASHTAPALAVPHTLLGLGRGLLSWSSCPVPLTAVVSREVDERNQTKDWVIVTTASSLSATQVRSTYDLRTTIEERHRQYKCFWDLTRMHSRNFALVVNQVLFVLLAYTLMQAHLLLRKRQELNRQTRTRTWQLLSPTLEVVAVYYRQRFCLLSVPEFARILLTLTEPARTKLLDKIRTIEKNLYSLLQNARPP